MIDTLTAKHLDRRKPPKAAESHRPHPYNIIHLVASPKKTKEPPISEALSQANLIQLTQNLAADAKSGKLKGLGAFAEYEEGYYSLGLEGSYLTSPESAVLPLMRLQYRIMRQVEELD